MKPEPPGHFDDVLASACGPEDFARGESVRHRRYGLIRPEGFLNQDDQRQARLDPE